jgi:hypothetical protein
VSVMSRKRAAEAAAADTGGRMQRPARPTVLVKAAVPVAKTAGLATRHGARSAAAWAAPRVNGARAWTAPRIERSGLAINDTIAPMIYEVLAATARRVDVTPRADVTGLRRRWPKVVIATAVLAGAAAAVAVVLRHRKDDWTQEAAEAESAANDPPAAA